MKEGYSPGKSTTTAKNCSPNPHRVNTDTQCDNVKMKLDKIKQERLC